MTNPFSPVTQYQAQSGLAASSPITPNVATGFASSGSSVPWVDDPEEKKRAHTACMFEREDGELCRGPRAKGTQYCIGHLRSLSKREENDADT